MSHEVVERQARLLATKNREAEPEITEIYWFPDDAEVRLVEVLANMPPSGEEIAPFYFRADPSKDLPVPSGIALVRPDEIRAKPLPKAWGAWDRAKRINEAGEVVE